MSNEELSEEDVKFQYITPAIIETAGWDRKNIRMEYSFTDGRIVFAGHVHHKKQPKYADYLLFDGNVNFPYAIVEAKKTDCDLTKGIQQAIEYAQMLDVPFAISSNGLAFREHDMITGKEREYAMNQFPTLQQMKERVAKEKQLNAKQLTAYGLRLTANRSSQAGRPFSLFFLSFLSLTLRLTANC